MERPFLHVPPFPGSKVAQLSAVGTANVCDSELDAIADLLRDARVGGTYWAAQPKLPASYVLVMDVDALERCRSIAGDDAIVAWVDSANPVAVQFAHLVVTGECDPWHLLAGATGLIISSEDEVSLVAALLGVPIYFHDASSGRLHLKEPQLARRLSESLLQTYLDPFTEKPIGAREAIALCAFWRRLIDKNRELAGGLGFAFWKRANVGALLWGGGEPFRFLGAVPNKKESGSIAVWRSKIPSAAITALEQHGHNLIEVEDGFIRSNGLGADCVPPLSIIVDSLGVHFDPAQPSELEELLRNGSFDDRLIGRARRLRQSIVETGLSKYGRDESVLARRRDSRIHLLVPGQVEDDRSVQLGGCGLATNLDLLARAREQSPEAYIIYKPHPDVVAGHRKGAISDRACLQYADEIVSDVSISSLIAMVDEVHVNTSLAGFEALMREKQVTTYGVPFYAGWGLTRDLGPVPSRRNVERTLDELVAATLLLYPRYLDPVTGLPCPPEVVAARLIGNQWPDTSLVITMRRLQGMLMRNVRSLVQ
jgi:capsular polysaccharide export protein